MLKAINYYKIGSEEEKVNWPKIQWFYDESKE